MPSFTPIIPSGSTDGRPIQLSDSSTELHDSVAGTTHMDEVFVYVNNTSATAVKVTIEVGAATAGFLIEDTIPAESGTVLMLPGIRVQNTTNIDGKAGTASVCNATVIVNRITLTEGL